MFEVNDIVFTKIKFENIDENQSGVIVEVFGAEDQRLVDYNKHYLVEFLTKDGDYTLEEIHESLLSKELV